MSSLDYLLARLHGIHSKSFLDDNFKKLKKVSSIEVLYKTLFPDEPSSVPVSRLYSTCEHLVKKKTFKQINYIATYFDYRVRLVNTLLLRYELDNVKLLVNAYYGGMKKAPDMFEVELIGTLNYEYIAECDMSDKSSVQAIFKDTVFDFLADRIETQTDLFLVENELDKYYYKLLLDSLSDLSRYEKKNLKQIIIEEMNWQNLSWAFRLKMYFRKSFANSIDTFLVDDDPGMIPVNDLENIFSLQFIAGEADTELKKLPKKYLDVIRKCYNEDGDFNLHHLEQRGYMQLRKSYSRFFFREYFNILPVISFIFLKKKEYANIVALIESIRYNFPLQDEEIA
jgi:vacuolar-type H+-ATPase subunit C/Vma6